MPNGTEDHVGFLAPQSKHIYTFSVYAHDPGEAGRVTLFAALVFSFSKSFCDWAFDAELMMAGVTPEAVSTEPWEKAHGQ